MLLHLETRKYLGLKLFHVSGWDDTKQNKITNLD
jgi:hypothetical protein